MSFNNLRNVNSEIDVALMYITILVTLVFFSDKRGFTFLAPVPERPNVPPKICACGRGFSITYRGTLYF